MIYYVHYRLWAILGPIAVEATCIVYLTSYKVSQ